MPKIEAVADWHLSKNKHMLYFSSQSSVESVLEWQHILLGLAVSVGKMQYLNNNAANCYTHTRLRSIPSNSGQWSLLPGIPVNPGGPVDPGIPGGPVRPLLPWRPSGPIFPFCPSLPGIPLLPCTPLGPAAPGYP